MEQGRTQTQQEGSIRSSSKGNRSTFRPMPLTAAVLEDAKQFLESLEIDTFIRMPLRAEKMEIALGKHKYFVLPHEQKYEPGFLIVRKGHPPLFLQGRLQFGCPLRLRLHQSVHEQGAIFVVTLDTVHAMLRLEDVFWYEGKRVQTLDYSRRYSLLETFFKQFFVADKKLSGLDVTLAQPLPLSNLREIVEGGQAFTVDLIPEQGGRRRLFLRLGGGPPVTAKATPISNAATATAPLPLQAPVVRKSIEKKDITDAFAYKILGLPDTYELKDVNTGDSLGKAAVQDFQTSQTLRKVIQTAQKGVRVNIQWYEEFERFKITELCA